MLKNISILLSVLITLGLIYLLVSSLYVFKKIDITEETNLNNKNLPYFKYSFEKVIYYKGVNTEFSCIETIGKMQDIETSQITRFGFDRCFSIKEGRIQNFILSSKLFDLVGFSFFYKPIFGFNDDAHKNEIYSIQNNQVVLGLFYIGGLIEKYMADPLIKEPYSILRNLDKIPHIIIKP